MRYAKIDFSCFVLTALFHPQLFGAASKRRATGSHLMNAQSSRSHFCCVFNIRKVSIPAGQKTSSKIHLIDLAGSEMVRN
jgi:hypothetical protein